MDDDGEEGEEEGEEGRKSKSRDKKDKGEQKNSQMYSCIIITIEIEWTKSQVP